MSKESHGFRLLGGIVIIRTSNKTKLVFLLWNRCHLPASRFSRHFHEIKIYVCAMLAFPHWRRHAGGEGVWCICSRFVIWPKTNLLENVFKLHLFAKVGGDEAKNGLANLGDLRGFFGQKWRYSCLPTSSF